MSRSSQIVTKQALPTKIECSSAFPFHSWSVDVVLDYVASNKNGLVAADIPKRRSVHGSNAFTPEKPTTLWHQLSKQLTGPLAVTLIVASGVTVLLEEFVDAAVIAIALLVAVVIGVIQEGRSSRAFATLANSQTRCATVIRDGKKQQIKAADVVFGDIVVLQDGDQVPADVRLIQAKQLSVNEAPLTGEWLAIDKTPNPVPENTAFAEQTSMAWMGTFIARGYGIGVVVATGDQTAVGQLAKDVREVEEVQTPIQKEMAQISRLMLYLIGCLVVVIFLIGVWRGLPLHEMVVMSVAVAVASIPEGMPAAVTIILAVGMEALLRRGGLVRNLLAAETLGSTTFVLTDKTGTLTQAKMSVTGLIDSAGNLHDTNKSSITEYAPIFDFAVVATNAFTDYGKSVPSIIGDPVEGAILRLANQLGIYEDKNSLRASRVDYLNFTSEQRFAAGLVPQADEFLLCINGAPDVLLAAATKRHTAERTVEMTDADRHTITAAIERQTKQGKRLVAVAYRHTPADDIDNAGEVLAEVVFAGVLVFDDPERAGVPEAIAGVLSAGAKIRLITGDNPQTALSIAQVVGIAQADSRVLVGTEIEALSDSELWHALQTVPVYARVLPHQKMRIAQVLQAYGEVVAMTGDGINDAPALRRANIGIAIGSGSAVAKEASDLILVKDSFAVIYAAIEEGRRITANLQKILGYLLSTSLSEVVLIAAAIVTGAPIPILPVQILWANIIEEGFMSVAFAFEPGDKNAMQRKPQAIHTEGILSEKMLSFIGLVIVIHGNLLVALYFHLQYLNFSIEELRSVMFLVIALDSLFISLAFRSLTTPLWRVSLWSNRVFVGSFVMSAIFFVGALSIPFLQDILQYEPIPLFDWVYVVGFSLLTLATVEGAKWFFFIRPKAAA